MSVIFENVTFIHIITFFDPVLESYHALLTFKGPVLFTSIDAFSIMRAYHTKISFKNYIELSNIVVLNVIASEITFVYLNTTINITKSLILESVIKVYRENFFYPPCVLQYYSENEISRSDESNEISDILIAITESEFQFLCNVKYCTSHCSWHSSALFQTLSPLDINQRFIHLSNQNRITDLISDEKEICYCIDDDQYDCLLDEINNIYPGQTVQFNLLHMNTVSELVVVNSALPTSCRVVKSSEISQVIYNNCTKVQYTFHHTEKWCELFLSTLSQANEAFYVKLLPCPLSFVLHPVEGYCQCDPILTSTTIISIASCNINDQTILRPPNSWISADVHNDSFVYEASSLCTFDYCLPHSSHLNVSNPDSQCQFNRTGLLCGRCKEGLSTVFGTSKCKHCTNNYLYIIMPIIIAGTLLVLVMFLVNLTVTDGTINGFILYANILSINSSVLLRHYSATYVFISLANLDLGIETCFTMVWMTMLKCGYNWHFPFTSSSLLHYSS